MKVKAKINEVQGTRAQELKDGDCAVITYWGDTSISRAYHGQIVMRHGVGLVAIGKAKDSAWPDITGSAFNRCMVRKFEPGESIVIE